MKTWGLGYFTLAWKWIPCWYASSLWSGTLESATSSTRLYLFLAGIAEGWACFLTVHSRLRGATVPFPNAPIPCAIQQRVPGGNAVHCCCLELQKVRSSRGARLPPPLFVPQRQSRVYFLIRGWKDRVSGSREGNPPLMLLRVSLLRPVGGGNAATVYSPHLSKHKAKPSLEQSYRAWCNQELREGSSPPPCPLQQRASFSLIMGEK